MVQIIGNAVAGYTYNAGLPSLPHDTKRIRPAHRLWCTGCKRKDRHLGDQGMCEQCARAAVTRAAQRKRWAEAEAAEAAAARPPRTRRATRRGPRRPPRLTVWDIGASSLQVKTWALEAGLVSQIRKGNPSGDLIAGYAAARDRGEVA